MPRASAASALSVAALCALAGLAGAQFPPLQAGFPVDPPGTGAMTSAVGLGDVDGDGLPDLVVGDSTGKVHAYNFRGSSGGFLWTFDTGQAMEVDGKPAIADVDGDGDAEVVVGAGSPFTPSADGGLYVISHTGTLQCAFQTLDGPDGNAFREGVYSSPALADLDFDDGGKLEIVFGSWDRHIRALHHDCTVFWDHFVDDTVWSSPAIADLDGDGDPDVVIGSDASNSPLASGWDGGLVVAYEGKPSSPPTADLLPGFPAVFDEVITSSPSLGDLVPGGDPEILVGTGFCWANPTCAPGGNDVPGVGEYFIGLDSAGDPLLPGWPVAAAGRHASGSPALADLDGDGALEAVFNSVLRSTFPNPEGGRVDVLQADGGSAAGWPRQPTTPTDCSGGVIHFSTLASPVVADVDGDGELNVVLPSNHELVIWDAGGVQLTRDQLTGLCAPDPGAWALVAGNEMSSPAVGDLDGDGDLEVVGASRDGLIYVWDFPAGTAGPGDTPWPMFKANSEGTSSAVGLPLFADGFESGDTTRWTSTTGG